MAALSKPTNGVNTDYANRVGLLIDEWNKGNYFFPATQVPSADANTLDDYEEGTFTPGISFGGGTTGITYSTQAGSYTKIGNRAMCSGFIAMTAKGSSTGSAQVTGMPFATAAGDGSYAAPSVRTENITYTGQLQGYAGPAASVLNLESVTEAGTNSARNDTHFANNSTIIFAVNYRTA